MTPTEIVAQLLRQLEDHELPIRQIPEEIARWARPEDVAAILDLLPADAQEVVIAWVQEGFASGEPTVSIPSELEPTPELDQAFIDWVRGRGRYHYPRREDEPELEQVHRRLGAAEPYLVQLRSKPWLFLGRTSGRVMDAALDGMPDDPRRFVLNWARETYASGKPLPEPRPWRVRAGSEDALCDWLRRHGLFHWP